MWNQTHLFSCDHGDDGDSLLPHHLPEVLTRVRHGTLRCDVAPLLPGDCYLMRQETCVFKIISHRISSVIGVLKNRAKTTQNGKNSEQRWVILLCQKHNWGSEMWLNYSHKPNTSVWVVCLLFMSSCYPQRSLTVSLSQLDKGMDTLCR